MPPPDAIFAIPGDLNTRTGGYIYARRLLETLDEIGQPLRHVALMPSWPEPSPAAEAELAAMLSALPPDMALILDGLVFGAMDTQLLAAQTRPVIAMLHHPLGLESGLPPARAAEMIARERANLRHAAHVVVPSPHTRDILVAEFGVRHEDISIALPGFDRPDPAGVDVAPASPPLVLSVGIICERKGHDILLRALARLTHLDWQAAIVGRIHDDAVYAALIALRRALGLEARVRFTGELAQAPLNALYRSARVFALATRYEGYGMVFSEAQLHALPVVSCAVGAVPQTVPEGAGLLVAPDDVPGFAAALEQMLTDDAAHARLAAGGAAIGAALPQWRDAARIMRGVLDHVSRR